MKKFILATSLFALCACAGNNRTEPQVEKGYIRSGETWYDADGAPIESHSAGFLFRDGVYYWYGENHAKGFYNKTGVSCYSSVDLLTWKNEGIVLPRDSFPLKYRAYTEDEIVPEGCPNDGVAERPKVIYNTKTGKYVLWVHLDAEGYTASEAGVAVSDSPTGPFTMVQVFRPVKYIYQGIDHSHSDKSRIAQMDERSRGNTYRDMALFADDDGKAYAIYSSENNITLYIVRLNDEYTDVETPLVEGKNWIRALPNGNREAPAPFKYKGKYYMITSGLTGWTPNPAEYHTADSMLGVWTTFDNPCIGPESETTFRSQSTYVLPVAGKPEGSFIFMADRWDNYQLENSRFVWLPFIVGDDGSIRLEYYSEWNREVFDQSATPLAPPHLRVESKGNTNTLFWKAVNGANAYRIFKNGKYVGITSNTRFELENELAGKGYNFTVTAIKLNGESSLPSNAVMVTWRQPEDVYLSNIKPDSWIQHWGFLRYDRSLENNPINIAGQVFEKGLGTHAPGEIVYYLCGNYSRLKGACGVDNFARFSDASSVVFKIIGDGKILFETGVMKVDTPAAVFDLCVKGISDLRLVTTDAGDGAHYDHADWADVMLVVSTQKELK